MFDLSLRKLTFAAVAALAFGAVSAVYSAGPARADDVVTTGGEVLKTVKLGLNKSLVVDLPRDARDILVSNPGIADAVIRTPRRIYLTGVAVGQSNVIIFDRAGEQIVTLDLMVERDASALEQMLRRLIPDSAIAVELVTDNIVLSGTVKNASDSRRAQDIANIFANGGAQAPVSTGGTTTAPVSNAAGGNISISLGPSQQQPTSNVINLLSIEGEDQVHLKVTVAEVQRNIAKQLGIDITGAGSAGSFVSSIITQNPFAVQNKGISDTALSMGYRKDGRNNLSGILRTLDQTGMVRTLAEPTLTAISGESASFLAGGEFPVPTGRDQDGNVTIEYKPFGVSLGFTPVVLSEGRISLRIKTEVSELSSENALQISGVSLPSIVVRRSETTLELPSGGSMVMGGLLQDSIRQSISNLPGLGKLPVLGTLFRSRDFKRNETELVIIVTPYLVKPVARTALSTPDEGFAPASDATANFLGRLNRVYGVTGKAAPAGAYRGTYGFIFE